MTTTTRSEKSQDAATILSGLAVENPPVTDEGAADDLANYLPGTLELVGEVGLDADYLDPLLKRLELDAVKHHVALARVLVTEFDALPDNPDDITDEHIASLQSSVEQEIKASKLTKKEKEDLAKYESQIDQGLRQSAEGLRAIRDGRLYREAFSSWDGYCTARWHFTGTSGDNKITWLKITELLEANVGKGVKLGVVTAKELLRLWDYPDLLVDALVAADEAAKSEGRKRTDADVRLEVGRRLKFVGTGGVPEAMSLIEFEAMTEAGIASHKVCSVMGRVREKQAEGRSFDEALNTTEDVVAARQAKLRTAKEYELDSVTADIEAIQKDHSLQELLGRKKSIQAELAKLDGDPQANGEVVEADDDAPEPSDEPATDVRQHLDDALSSLGEAFTGIWPEEDPDELDEIRVLAEKCEDKLAEIIAKAKEILADADEPVSVSFVES